MKEPKEGRNSSEGTETKEKPQRPGLHPRAGWEKAFRRMAAAGDDALLDGDRSLSSWDEEEWEWAPLADWSTQVDESNL